MQKEARRRSKAMPHDRETASRTRAARPAEIRVSMPVSLPCPPVEIGAPARSQLGYRLDRIGADRKRPQVEIARSARGPPARIFALGCNKFEFDRDTAVSESRNADIKSIADLQALDEILAKIEMNPDVGQIDQGNQLYARRYICARLHVALVDLRGDGGIDHELIDDRLNALDIGIGLFDAGPGNGSLLFCVAIDGLFVG